MFRGSIVLGMLAAVLSPDAAAYGQAATSPSGGMDTVQALLDAIRQAQRPTTRLRVQWAYESAAPSGMFLDTGQHLPDEPLHTKQRYTAYLSGIKSRIECHMETYASAREREPYDVRDTVSVFDGTRQVRFTDRLKGRLTTPLGWQYPRDKNAVEVREQLWGNVIPIDDPASLSKYNITYSESDTSGVYVLTAIAPTTYYKAYRLTVDGTRGFHIVKVESLKSTGEKYYEVDITLKQYPDGTWFPAERTRTDFQENGHPRVLYKVSVTDVSLNPEIPDSLFEFRFPQGTQIWDETLQMWFNAAGSNDPTHVNQVIGTAAARSETLPKRDPAKSSNGNEGHGGHAAPGPSGQTSRKTAVIPWLLGGLAAVAVVVILAVFRTRRAKT